MAGTTNLQQWNPTAVNQETDAQYAADSQRAGGATDPSVFLSVLANKAFFQWSTYLTALFEAFAAKGFTTSDSNIGTLTAQCANFLTTADAPTGLASVTAAATLNLNAANVAAFYIPLTSNCNIAAITGLSAGQKLTIIYAQDSGGGHVVTFPSNWTNGTTPDPTGGSVSVQEFIYNPFDSQLQSAGPLINAMTMFISALNAATVNCDTANVSTLITALAGHIATVNASVITTFTLVASTSLTAGSISSGGNITGAGLISTGGASVAANLNVGSLQIGGGAPNGQVLTGDGTHYVPQNLPAPPALSVVRNDVTGARGFGTTYTNTSGGMMTVAGYGSTGGSSVGSLACFVNGDADFANTATATVAGGACGFSFVVPPGATYSVQANTLTGGAGTDVHGPTKWIETIVTI